MLGRLDLREVKPRLNPRRMRWALERNARNSNTKKEIERKRVSEKTFDGAGYHARRFQIACSTTDVKRNLEDLRGTVADDAGRDKSLTSIDLKKVPTRADQRPNCWNANP